jgi:hypothetical protein
MDTVESQDSPGTVIRHEHHDRQPETEPSFEHDLNTGILASEHEGAHVDAYSK